MTTHTFEESGHIIGIPDRYLTRDVETALVESGPRVAVAIAETVKRERGA